MPLQPLNCTKVYCPLHCPCALSHLYYIFNHLLIEKIEMCFDYCFADTSSKSVTVRHVHAITAASTETPQLLQPRILNNCNYQGLH